MTGKETPFNPRRTGRKKHTRQSASNMPTTNDTEGKAPIHVGRCIREIREESELSIRALAEQSGLAVNTLSLIENGKTSPSVSTLQQIAGALQVPITAFFEMEPEKSQKRVVYTREQHRPCAHFTHGNVEDLAAGMAERLMEPFVFTMEPGAVSGTNPIVHTGQEFVYCLEGRIAYMVDNHTYLLEPGDSLAFESHLPHRWQNVATQQSKAILILCPFDPRDRATELHFTEENIQFSEA